MPSPRVFSTGQRSPIRFAPTPELPLLSWGLSAWKAALLESVNQAENRIFDNGSYTRGWFGVGVTTAARGKKLPLRIEPQSAYETPEEGVLPKPPLQPLSFGPLPLPTRFLLAPLAGYTNLGFRMAVRELAKRAQQHP